MKNIKTNPLFILTIVQVILMLFLTISFLISGDTLLSIAWFVTFILWVLSFILEYKKEKEKK